MKKALLMAGILLLATLCFAQTPAHPNWVTFERTTPSTGTIRWSAEPSANVSYYYLALHPTGTMYTSPAYCDPNWNVPGGWAGSFVMDAPGVYRSDVNALDPLLDYYAYVAAVETSGWSWSAYSSWEPPITLPVELSSFTATLTAQTYVTLAWTTQSETSLMGYRIYRSENQNVADAIMITPSLIPATNTSTTCTYQHCDLEVAVNTTYWYWLESVEYNGGEMHGPISVMVSGGDPGTPNIPASSSVGYVYPNPARIGNTASLDVDVKAGETAFITIYNTRGQIVNNMEVPAGYHQVNWDGSDSHGKLCASGVYLYLVRTPSLNQTRKLIILK